MNHRAACISPGVHDLYLQSLKKAQYINHLATSRHLSNVFSSEIGALKAHEPHFGGDYVLSVVHKTARLLGDRAHFKEKVI